MAEVNGAIGVGQGGGDEDFARHGRRKAENKARFYREDSLRRFLKAETMVL
jgi:hypothetical protein